MTAIVMRRRRAGTPGVTQIRAIHSEWIKLRSLRSTWFGLAVMAATVIGLGYLLSLKGYSDATQFGAVDPDFDPVQVSLQGIFPAQLAAGVLGALFVTGEYGTGMIRATLTAVPRRRSVLAAKMFVIGATTFVVALAASLVAFLLGQRVLDHHHLGVSLSSPGAARAVVLSALFLTCIAWLGAALGFAMRHAAAAIVAPLLLVVASPILVGALPGQLHNHVERYLPLDASTNISRTKIVDLNALGPWSGAGAFALYALVALVLGAVVLRHKDA